MASSQILFQPDPSAFLYHSLIPSSSRSLSMCCIHLACCLLGPSSGGYPNQRNNICPFLRSHALFTILKTLYDDCSCIFSFFATVSCYCTLVHLIARLCVTQGNSQVLAASLLSVSYKANLYSSHTNLSNPINVIAFLLFHGTRTAMSVFI